MQAAQCRKLLVSGRAAVGWLSVLAPNLVGRAWRIQPPLDSNVKYAIRLFGARNALLAYQLYQAERSDAAADELEEVLRQGLAVDAFDVLFGLAYRSRYSQQIFRYSDSRYGFNARLGAGVLWEGATRHCWES